MSREVVGFGPSLVDISARLPECRYEQCLDMLDVAPGGWRHLEHPEEAEALLGFVAGEEVAKQGLLKTLNQSETVSVVAGSSTFGMLGAMNPELRCNSTLVTALAEQDGELDPLSRFFEESVQSAGLRHDSKLVPGYNPTGFVISGEFNPEKTLAMYPGVAGELEDYDLDREKPGLVMIDTYELQSGKLAVYLDNLIDSGEHRIALSLGNHNILRDALGDQVREYIERG